MALQESLSNSAEADWEYRMRGTLLAAQILHRQGRFARAQAYREASQEQDLESWRPNRSAFPPPFAKPSEGRPRAVATRL